MEGFDQALVYNFAVYSSPAIFLRKFLILNLSELYYTAA